MTKRKFLHTILILSITILPTCLIAAEEDYHSVLANRTNQHHSRGFTLFKTRMWPTEGCLLDTGKEMLRPGESTVLRIKKDKACNQGGIGYEIYRAEDSNKKHLLGYLSHRFADEKFSVQISRFCEGDTCVFMDLNPEQDRKM